MSSRIVVDALVARGGSATVEYLKAHHYLAPARLTKLKKQGIVRNPVPGVWEFTDRGRAIHMQGAKA